jgi:hypothetical protein
MDHIASRIDGLSRTRVVTPIRYHSRLQDTGPSKHLHGTNVTVLIVDRDIRVLGRNTGQLIRKLTRDYQPRGVKLRKQPPKTPCLPMLLPAISERAR